MNRRLTTKLGFIALLMLILLIPIRMIDGLIGERQRHRDTVVADIARSSSFQQIIAGPLLVVPYRRLLQEQKISNGIVHEVERQTNGVLTFLPEQFELQGKLDTEIRGRGIYQARLYHLQSMLSGSFSIPPHWGIEDDIEDYHFDRPYLALGINDIRGIENSPRLDVAGESIAFEPGSGVAFLGDGIHATLPFDSSSQNRNFTFSLPLRLQGTESFQFVPVGRESRITISSDWPHPSFTGDYLPLRRTINDEGFSAQWQTSFFSTNMEEMLSTCLENSDCHNFVDRKMGLKLIDPVDHYLKSDRAIKYAYLFIGLTFGGIFLVEVLKQLSVHPMQYGLVGLALAIFYLLLLSLSEHMPFFSAYLIAATACVLINSLYVSNILNGWEGGIGFGAGISALYGLLYVLLRAEDYALLTGSLLVFAVLSLFMLLTRNVDWFVVGNPDSSDRAEDRNNANSGKL